MRIIILVMMLALTAMLVALSSAPATDLGPSTRQDIPIEVRVAPEAKGLSATQDSKEDGKRGQLEEMMPLCDVAPPCPSGCTVDANSHKCIEWPRP